MSNADFVHLHLHTEYSLLDGACRLDRLMDKAAALKFPALALTDHGVMHGAVEFYEAAKKRGLKPILGCEVYVAPGSRLEKKPGAGMRDIYHHLVLLARNETGYHNLVRLVTAANLEGFYYKPRIDKELLAQHADGLIALSGCLASEIPESILKGDEQRARDAIDWFKQVLGADNFFLELQNHGIAEQARVNRALIPWAREFGLRLVASNDVHYVERNHWKAHDCLICIGTQSLLTDTKRMRYQPEQFYLRTADEMKALFAEIPEAVLNTVAVAEQCDLELKFPKGTEHYPVFQPPATWTREGYLRHRLCEGLEKRYSIKARVEGERIVADGVADPSRLPLAENNPGGESVAQPTEVASGGGSADAAPADSAVSAALQVVLDRVNLECGIIAKTGYVSYFLIVGDFVRHARSIGAACAARGSAAGSLVTYLLDISSVDPIRYGLLFERFLNPERISPPDIDIDFTDTLRGQVIAYVREKYGADSVAQIVTFQTMGAKSVLRDVGRVMGLSFGECDRLAKMVTDGRWDLKVALEKNPDFKAAYGSEEVTRELVDYALILEDQARGTGVHAAGVVIGAQPLVNLLPLKSDDEGGLVTQYSQKPVEKLGLLKMDFLGLKTLTVIQNCVELIRRTTGVTVPIEHPPLDDAKTYHLLNHAQTLGVFQLESGGMRDLCRKFQIESIEHITALISLFRPGPMDLIPDFIERRHGRKEVTYDHPLLEPVARETYGVLIYQEQVMQAARVLAGYTLGGADILRRAMGKKDPDEMAKQRAGFVHGCAAQNQIPAAKANEIFDTLEKFAGYGFNKSHAAAYAVTAYQTAYLKANHPVEFLCAMMTNDQASLEKLAQYIVEARGFGLEVLGPDVNESDLDFAPAPSAGSFQLPPAAGAATSAGSFQLPISSTPTAAVAAGGGSWKLPAQANAATTRRIRFGLAAIKGVGEIAVQSVLDARQRGGRFTSLPEFCERIDTRAVNRKVLECLIRAGACDSLGSNRATLFAQIDPALSRATSLASDKVKGQASFFETFESSPSKARAPDKPVELPEWEPAEKLKWEKELLGFYLSGHPLEPHAKLLERYTLHTIEGLAALENRAVTRVGGLVTAVQQGVSKKSGKPYAMVTLEDMTGTVQLLAMNEAYDRYRELFTANAPLLVTGEVNTGEDKPKIFPIEILRLEDAPRKFTRQVHLRFRTEDMSRDRLESARELVAAHKGSVPVVLRFLKPDGVSIYLEVSDHFGVTPSRALQDAADELFGAGTYFPKVDSSLPERTPRRWERRGEATAEE